MKKIYERPLLEVEMLAYEDVCTVSNLEIEGTVFDSEWGLN